MCLGYIVLFMAVTLLAALVKGQVFHFSLSLNLITPLICTFITERLPSPALDRTKDE